MVYNIYREEKNGNVEMVAHHLKNTHHLKRVVLEVYLLVHTREVAFYLKQQSGQSVGVSLHILQTHSHLLDILTDMSCLQIADKP